MRLIITRVIFILFILLFTCRTTDGYAYNMRQTFSADGLSNSAILSMALDDNGYLWIGTCDGVNIADGTSVYPFSTIFPGKSLTGNIIELIKQGTAGDMWILSNYGLDHFDIVTWELTNYPQFRGQELLIPAPKGKMYIFTEDSALYGYDPENGGEMKKIGKLDRSYSDIRSIAYKNGRLWAVTSNGINIYDVGEALKKGDGKISSVMEYRHPVKFAKARGEHLFVVTTDNDFCEVADDGNLRSIHNISDALSSKGRISDILRDHQGNYFISFSTDGVLMIGKNRKREFEATDLGLHVGVFCLECSGCQDVVWIGSDCQGVYTFWDDRFSIRSYDFNLFGNKISHPVRAIYIDEYKNMWIGTKGDGVLRVSSLDEYSPRQTLRDGQLYTSSNSALWHNSVYAFGKSRRPILWVGTDDGLNYFNYAEQRLRRVDAPAYVKCIHGIYEESDTVLWMCTLGHGVMRCRIAGTSGNPELKDIKVYDLDKGKYSSNQFFSMTLTPSGELLFNNRGKGIYRMKDGRLDPIPLKNDFGTKVVDDVFTSIVEKDTLWLGTGQGLIMVTGDNEKRYCGVEDGFTNNTIHDMLLDKEGDLWISTNDGIVRFMPDENRGETYGKNYGLNVNEYSDGAAFDTGNTLIFGGINGITFINRHLAYTPATPFMPTLSFLKLSISGEDVPIVDYLKRKKGKTILELGPDQNYFDITVAAPDFIDAHNYVYSYTLDGVNWISTGSGKLISFNGMAYGNYNLSVRYMNRVTGMSSEPNLLQIHIKAPWYLTGFAKFIYLLLILGVLLTVGWLYMRRQKERQRQELDSLERTHKEELYEEKLKFFTNITHEFCTPLTLIYGPCERISTYAGSDDYIKRYIGLIRGNAERLNTLIQELIDFRRMETGNKRLKLSKVDVSILCCDIMTSFSELADRNNVTLVNEIEPEIDWVTDFGCIRKIMTNLISNAFKYTPNGGTIKIGVKREGDKLRLFVYNTGKGITEEEKRLIFNRYSVLDNVEENAVKGLSNRNGLGLAICHSMVDMLKGTIDIESEPGKFAEFIVDLPRLELPEENTDDRKQTVSDESDKRIAHTEKDDRIETAEAEKTEVPDEEIMSDNIVQPRSDNDRILVVDDNKEILLLLRDSLSDYEVILADNADKALDVIRQAPPDLIISDIMMPGTDGVTFTRMVKQNKHTMHIPLVLLSAKTSNQEKIEGIDSGADAYIGKPFSLSYLIAVVNRLLENRRHLREYYSTGASAYEYSEGRLLHKEEKDFMEKIVSYIEENIESEDLGPEKLAEHMKISVRNLYRKFKELDQLSPNDFIKNQRVSFAARLLLTTSATVQEVIYRSGFTNRSHFYKEFDKRFGMTPKLYRQTKGKKDRSLDSDKESDNDDE